MEPEPAQVPSPAPLNGQCIGRRRRRHGGVESGVEAGHGGHVREHAADGLKAPQGFGLVQRGQVGQRLQTADHPGIHEHRARKLGPAMDDAVAHRVDRAVMGDDILQGGLVHLAPGRGQDLRT
jgi:hypothetical protein